MADDKVTISTYQFLKRFPNAEAARSYLEARRWPQGAVCPACGCIERIQTRKLAGYFRCLNCQTDFTVRTGTIFERSHVPLDKWLYAMYLMATARKGISSLQLSKELGVTQKTAWFMLQRLPRVNIQLVASLDELANPALKSCKLFIHSRWK